MRFRMLRGAAAKVPVLCLRVALLAHINEDSGGGHQAWCDEGNRGERAHSNVPRNADRSPPT